MIPCNQLEQALTWMEKSVVIVTDADGLKTHHFDSWNADAFYFFDASGNIAEFIVRYDLQNDNHQRNFPLVRKKLLYLTNLKRKKLRKFKKM